VPVIIWIAVGAFGLLIVAAVIVTLVTSLRSPVHKVKGTLQLRQVLAMSSGACPGGAPDRVPSVKADACYQLGDGMKITKVRSAELKPDMGGTGGWSVDIGLRPEDTGRLGTLTTQVSAEQQPRNLLAIEVDGKVVSAPQVMGPITGGTITLTGRFTRDEAERFVKIFGG
jgi:preprotein translocase subunit SecD